jgi:hypothetical protein
MAAMVVEKSIVKSKTVWGALIASLPAVDTLLVLTGVLPVPFLGESAALLINFLGSALAIFGRVKASTKIK